MLTVIGGPMFAGKTTYLINLASKLPIKSYWLFKPSIDIRYSHEALVTHDGLSLKGFNLDNQRPKFPVLETVIKTIFIDELNFFKAKPLLSELSKIRNSGINVVAAGLMYDSNRRPFGATLPLSKIADKYIQLYAVCDGCGRKAEHSYVKKQKTKQIALGAKEMYGVCCEQCWQSFNINRESV